MKISPLEKAFAVAFKKKLIEAGFSFETQVVIPGARFRYDVSLKKIWTRKNDILIEIDGHGLGHSSVASLARDAQKANHAILSGYRFFRLTTKHFRQKKGKRIPGDYAKELVQKIIEGV